MKTVIIARYIQCITSKGRIIYKISKYQASALVNRVKKLLQWRINFMKSGKISFSSNLYVILIHGWNNLLHCIFLLFCHGQTSKGIFIYGICHILGQNMFAFYKYYCHRLYLFSSRCMSNLLENCDESRMIDNLPLNNTLYIWNINLHSYSIHIDYYPSIASEKFLQPISLCYCL